MRRTKWIIFAFLLIVSLWVVLVIYRANLTPWFELHFGNGFIVSYLASLLEDILFFGLIGFVAFVLSTRKPEDENFVVRIRSLANNKSVGEKAKEFLSNFIMKKLAYNSHVDVRLIIKEFSQNENCIKLYSEFTGEMINMCKDIKYPVFDIDFLIEPNEKVNNSYGYISYLGINDPKASQQQILVEKDIFELKDNKVYKRNFNFAISEDSSAIWQMSFATWGKIDANRANKDNWYFVGVFCYTESLNIQISNDTSKEDLKCDVRYVSRDARNSGKRNELNGIELKPRSKESILGNNIVFHPDDKFEIYFHT
jgi:hypothetical protein